MQGTGPGEGKAVRTRDRVVEWLAAHGDVSDVAGMASPRLAQAVAYPGSSVAFAQLLSGMERSGLIIREVRGKRTYLVSLAPAGHARARALAQQARGDTPLAGASARPARRRGAAAARPRPAGQADSGQADQLGTGNVADYDELARRLLAQVARRLLPTAGADVDSGAAVLRAGPSSQRRTQALEDKVAALEHELMRVRAARDALEAENDGLREQLERIRGNLDQAQARLRPRRRPTVAEGLDQSEIALLQRLIGRSESEPADRAGTA